MKGCPTGAEDHGEIDVLRAAGDAFDGMESAIQSSLDLQAFPQMEQAGIPQPHKITYVFANPDGTELWNKTFEAS